MLLNRTGIHRKKVNLSMYVMKDIAHCGCIKGFVYRFMYVRVREKMADKVITSFILYDHRGIYLPANKNVYVT